MPLSQDHKYKKEIEKLARALIEKELAGITEPGLLAGLFVMPLNMHRIIRQRLWPALVDHITAALAVSRSAFICLALSLASLLASLISLYNLPI